MLGTFKNLSLVSYPHFSSLSCRKYLIIIQSCLLPYLHLGNIHIAPLALTIGTPLKEGTILDDKITEITLNFEKYMHITVFVIIFPFEEKDKTHE